MKKILAVFILGIFLISFVNASEELFCWRDAKQGTNIELIQKCDSCTFNNVTSITYPNGSNIIINEFMTKDGIEYNYTLPDNTQLGKLIYSTVGDKDGASPPKQQTLCINITPSGKSGAENIIFFVLVLGLLYTLTFIFFFKRIPSFTTLSGMTLGFFGLYMIRNGIIIYRDALTNYVSYITMFIGFGLGLWALIEWIQEEM